MEVATKIRVFIVDHHPLVLEGLRRILESDEEIEVVGEARNCDEAIIKACSVSPNVILMDLETPSKGSIPAIRELRRRLPESRVLILSLGDKPLAEAIEAGASGYSLKEFVQFRCDNGSYDKDQGIYCRPPSSCPGGIAAYTGVRRGNRGCR